MKYILRRMAEEKIIEKVKNNKNELTGHTGYERWEYCKIDNGMLRRREHI